MRNERLKFQCLCFEIDDVKSFSLDDLEKSTIANMLSLLNLFDACNFENPLSAKENTSSEIPAPVFAMFSQSILKCRLLVGSMFMLYFLLSDPLPGKMERINKPTDINGHTSFLNFIFISASCFIKYSCKIQLNHLHEQPIFCEINSPSIFENAVSG